MKIANFIVEELPVSNVNGQSTYNHAFIDALLALGYAVEVLVVGPRVLPKNLRAQFKKNNSCKVKYLHGTEIFGFFLPYSIPSLLRSLYSLLKSINFISKLTNKVRGRDLPGQVYIARKLSGHEQIKIDNYLEKSKADVVFIDTIFRMPSKKVKQKIVLIGHDVFHSRCESLVNGGFTPVPLIDKNFELELLIKSDLLVAITETDRQHYQAMGFKGNVTTLYSPIQCELRDHIPTNKNRILFMGSRGALNVEGLRWFIQSVFPLIQNSYPDVMLDVVGTVCGEIATDHLDKHIKLHGRVDDITSIVDDVVFAINPVLAGSGLKIKMLDYFANGLACITTPCGAEGFPEDINRPIAVCDSVEAFASMCITWLDQSTLQVKHAEQARLYSQHFMPQHFAEKLNESIKVVVNA